jgi:hypothetical protein
MNTVNFPTDMTLFEEVTPLKFPVLSQNEEMGVFSTTTMDPNLNTAGTVASPTPAVDARPLALLTKRKGKLARIDHNSPQARLFEIIEDPNLTRHNTRKARKTSADETVPLTPTEDTTALTEEVVVIKNGVLEFVAPPTATKVVRKTERLTSNTFLDVNRADKWEKDETEKFFRGLELFGMDFSMIAILFPKRNRDQIKNKFHKEERVNPDGIDAALKTNANKGSSVSFADMAEFQTFFATALAHRKT